MSVIPRHVANEMKNDFVLGLCNEDQQFHKIYISHFKCVR